MRKFSDGETIYIEPFRAKPFPILKDLMVDRSSFDRVIESGGYVSVRTGSAVDANSMPIEKDDADTAFDAATCIGCGACVASCKNASAMLFVSAKVKHLNSLPQGAPEKTKRVVNMVNQMDKEGFGNCTNNTSAKLSAPNQLKLNLSLI
jgi:succinate dehydrogenase / fumarate reductase iron-sulfur subunit